MTIPVHRHGLKHGTAAEWTAANPILALGEEGYETDTKLRKVGDGTTAYNSLAYQPGGVSTVAGVSPVSSDVPAAGLATALQTAGLAPKASPALTGTPTAPTPTPGDNTTKVSTTAFVAAAIAALVNSSPSALDTLKELADALGDDANFATTVTNALATKAPVTTTTIDLVDRTNNTTETVPAGTTTNCSTAGVTKTAPALDNPVATPPKRFAVKNLASGSITVSYPDQSGAAQSLTVLPAETRTFRQKSTSGWGVESGAIAVATLDARYQPLSLEGTLAARPAANTVTAKTIYFATDVAGGTLYRSDGTSWAQIAPGVNTSGAVLASVVSTSAQATTTSTSVVDLSPGIVTSTFVADGTQVVIEWGVPALFNNTAGDGVWLQLTRNDGTNIDHIEAQSSSANQYAPVGSVVSLDTPTAGVTTSYKMQIAAITGGTANIKNLGASGQNKIVVRHP